MKKHFSLRSLTLSLIALTLLVVIVIITTTNSKAAPTLANKLSGRILLQVEDSGSVWYISPDNNNQRIQLRSPLEIFCFMKTLGLGISNNDLNNYLDNKFPTRLAGKILLAVEQHGEAYYINPLTLQGHYLGRPQEALKLMKGLALGISNTNLNTIDILDTTKMLEDCHIIIKPNDQEISKIKEKVDSIITNISLITQEVEPMIDFSHIISISTIIDNPNNLIIKEKGLLYDYTFLPDNNLTPTLDKYNKKIISSTESNDNNYTLDITNLTSGSYPFIRAYLITEDNKVIYGNTITVTSISNGGLPNLPVSSSSPSPTIPEDPLSVLTATAIDGVDIPVTGATPVTKVTAEAGYTGIVAWSPAVESTFLPDTVYTATITLTPTVGYTLTGVVENQFKIAGATTTNPINSGVITAVFPATTALLAVGDTYGGGKVAYILVSGDSGYDAGAQQGLIAATENQGTGMWTTVACQSTSTLGAAGTAIGTGYTNTKAIIAQAGAGDTYAAGLARAYRGGGFTDWFLPSKYELDKLYLNKDSVGEFVADNYWSSSENNAGSVWFQSFLNGSQDLSGKGKTLYVRAVRAF